MKYAPVTSRADHSPAYVPLGEMFTIGIGPSSSHTVGPMRAGRQFIQLLHDSGHFDSAVRIGCRLRGSLGSTGLGHGTPDAVIAGLSGLQPETCDPREVKGLWEHLRTNPVLVIEGRKVCMTHEELELAPFDRHPDHANALDFNAIDAQGQILVEETYLSIGGGFVVRVGEASTPSARSVALPHSFRTFDELLVICRRTGRTIAEIAAENEAAAYVDPAEVADRIWTAMSDCIQAGRTSTATVLPGGLGVRARAPQLDVILRAGKDDQMFGHELSRIQLDALAVNEENARGNRVVTAPTNGAAGIIPAVLSHYIRAVSPAPARAVRDFLLTANVIGSIIKASASISGAQVGCQGEVGSACAMAAGALVAVLGGSPEQVGKAAEIGLEHHLGLTCDPVGGLVQIPCIERNAIASVTAVQAATLTMNETQSKHHVTLDVAILTMANVGADMLDKYKETSTGGLAVSVIEC
jgi:L-serine dehydratase